MVIRKPIAANCLFVKRETLEQEAAALERQSEQQERLAQEEAARVLCRLAPASAWAEARVGKVGVATATHAPPTSAVPSPQLMITRVSRPGSRPTQVSRPTMQ